MKKDRYNKGFTLVELMVTIAIASILLTVAVPAFRSMAQNNRATTYSNQFVTDLSLARIEAIKRGDRVFVTSLGATWAEGWRIWIDTDNNGAYNNSDINIELIKEAAAFQAGASLTSDDGLSQIGFLSSGLIDLGAILPTAPVWPSNFSLRVPHCTGKQGRDIQINQTGRSTTTTVDC